MLLWLTVRHAVELLTTHVDAQHCFHIVSHFYQHSEQSYISVPAVLGVKLVVVAAMRHQSSLENIFKKARERW